MLDQSNVFSTNWELKQKDGASFSLGLCEGSLCANLYLYTGIYTCIQESILVYRNLYLYTILVYMFGDTYRNLYCMGTYRNLTYCVKHTGIYMVWGHTGIYTVLGTYRNLYCIGNIQESVLYGSILSGWGSMLYGT